MKRGGQGASDRANRQHESQEWQQNRCGSGRRRPGHQPPWFAILTLAN